MNFPIEGEGGKLGFLALKGALKIEFLVTLTGLATRVDGGLSLLNNVTGFLVPPKEPQALAEALKKLIDDPELRRRMGQAGREKALREFTLDRMLRETKRVYERVLKLSGTVKTTSTDTPT